MISESKPFLRVISASAAAFCMFSAMNYFPAGSESVTAADVMQPFEITENMKVGWNLGNTLESTSSSANPGLNSETAWGNPKATKELISAVKAKGFNTIRVPVTWYQHVDGDFNISEEWLARVKEVVDYAYNDGMYVILNVHHEEWINRTDFATAYDDMSPKLKKLWTQIATYFADYDQHLIFEGMNEPRAAGTDIEWSGDQACYEVVNKLDQDFVDTVRSIESPYKDTRLLMVPDYCASGYDYIYSNLEVPDDDYICVSLHAYSPYDFAMNPNADMSAHQTFTTAYANELDSLFANMREYFTDKDIPVVIGEFGASNFGNTDARAAWAEYYVAGAKKYGIPCVLWDNNVINIDTTNGEAHGYINRNSLEWYPESEPVVDAMMKSVNDDSNPWGAEKKAPVYKHKDLDSGKVLYKDDTGQKIDASVPNGNCTQNYDITWEDLIGKEVAVKYTGDKPILAFMDSNWDNWTEVNAYTTDKENGIAYYSYESIRAAWTHDTDIAHLCLRTNSVTTILEISIIDAPELVETPTETPTEAPTETPSEEPTEAPTDEATEAPTETPTDEPTEAPTEAPTGESTEAPTGGDTPVNAEYGDANLDGTIDVTDVVSILSYVVDPKNSDLTEEGKNVSDVYQRGDGIQSNDAASVAKYIAKNIDKLPES